MFLNCHVTGSMDALSFDEGEPQPNHINNINNSTTTLNGTGRLMSQRRHQSTTIPMEDVTEDFLNTVRTNRSTSINNAGTFQPPPDYWTANPTAPPEEGGDRRESWGGISAPPAYSDIVSRENTMSTRDGRGVTPPPSYYAAVGTHRSDGGVSRSSGYPSSARSPHGRNHRHPGNHGNGSRPSSQAGPLAVKPVPINETDSDGAEPIYRDLISKRRRRGRRARARLRRHSTSSSSSQDDDDDDDDYY